MFAIASLTFVGQLFTAGYAKKTEKGQAALAVARDMRQQTETISADTLHFILSKTHADRLAMKHKIEDEFNTWDVTSKSLEKPADFFGLDAKQAAGLSQEFADLQTEYAVIRSAIPPMLKHVPQSHLPDMLKASDGIYGDLDKIDDSVHKSFEEETRASRIVIVGVAFATLLVLVAEYIFVFRPKLMSMKATSQELATTNQQLESDNEVIAEHNSKLEALNNEITEVQERYADAARRMSDLFNGLPVAVFSFDRTGKIEEWNEAAEKLFGIHPLEATQKTIFEILGESVPDEKLQEWVHAPFEGRPVENALWNLGSDDDQRSISSSVFGVHGYDHRVFGGICVNIDVTERVAYESQLEQSMLRINEYSLELEMQKNELEEANGKLETLAVTDGLTGLKNHRFFQELVESAIETATSSEEPLSVMLMDVDKFKQFNDTYGHQAGDDVLKAIAKVLLETQSPCFQPARYGGEEFVAVMQGLSEAEAFELAEIVRQRIELSKPVGHEVTASFGIATWDAKLRGKGELVARADKALYASKNAGRNRVTRASSLWEEDGTEKAA